MAELLSSMGSLESAYISGFLCRLCSKLSRYVILIYSEEGQKMGLTEKINTYLPVTVTRDDKLPKTVCMECILQLSRHHNWMKMFEAFLVKKPPLQDPSLDDNQPKT